MLYILGCFVCMETRWMKNTKQHQGGAKHDSNVSIYTF